MTTPSEPDSGAEGMGTCAEDVVHTNTNISTAHAANAVKPTGASTREDEAVNTNTTHKTAKASKKHDLTATGKDYMSRNRLKKGIVVLVTVLMIVVVFVPTWWVTTRVYRADLPMDEMHSRNDHSMDMHLNVTLDILDKVDAHTHSGCALNLDILAERTSIALKNRRYRVLNIGDISRATLKFNVRAVDESSSGISKNADDDLRAHTAGASGEYRIYLNHSEQMSDVASSTLLLDSDRSGVLNYGDCSPEKLAESVQQSITKITGGYEFPNSNTDRAKNSVTDKYTKPETRYHVRVSVLVADDRAHRLQWDTRTIFEEELRPMLITLEDTINITYSSQIVYHAALDPQRLTVHYDAESAEHYLTPSDLKVFVDPIDWNFGTATSDTTLNLLVYIPSPKETPLRIRDENSVNTETNSFYLPGWGGVVVVNTEKDKHHGLPSNATIVTHLPDGTASRVFSTFRQNLRALLSAPHETNDDTTSSTCTAGPEGVCQWEADIMQRRRIVQYIDEAFRSMSSLGKLLESIPSMAIADHLQQDVLTALSEISRCEAFVQEGQYPLALAAAERAYQHAEKAFFDPSILEMLYFPDDRKYAIYLPLFMPLGVSILVSIKKVWKDR